MLCAFLSQRFTLANGSNEERPSFNKWKNTAWVNPWTGVARFPVSAKSLTTAMVHFHHECRQPQWVNMYNVTIDAVNYEGCSMVANTDILYIPDGAYIYIGVEVHPVNSGFHVYVEDHSGGGTIYFDDTPPSANFNFQVQAGREYTVWTETF